MIVLKRIAILLIIFSGMIVCSPPLQGNAFLATASFDIVACIVDNEFQGFTHYPAIAQVEFSNNVSSSEIRLTCFGTPVLNESHGYRIIISWHTSYNINSTDHCPDHFNWENTAYPTSNFTQCYAGGVKGFGVVNGSHSEFYDHSGTLIFSETNNNSVIVEGNSLIFPVNQSLIGSTSLNPDNQFMAFSNFNTTQIDFCPNMTTPFSNITLVDALPTFLMLCITY